MARPRGKECRERIKVDTMWHDEGQEKLRAAEKRLAPAASAARAEVAQEGQASLARVEVAQESPDEEMTEACVTSVPENVKPRIEESREDSTAVSSRTEDKPRIEVSREDSTEVISRMDDGNTGKTTGIGRGDQLVERCSVVDKARIRGKRNS